MGRKSGGRDDDSREFITVTGDHPGRAPVVDRTEVLVAPVAHRAEHDDPGETNARRAPAFKFWPRVGDYFIGGDGATGDGEATVQGP